MTVLPLLPLPNLVEPFGCERQYGAGRLASTYVLDDNGRVNNEFKELHTRNA
jgi:hypothetical protein